MTRGDDIQHKTGPIARVVAVEAHHVHARLWTHGWPFPGMLVTWRKADVEVISKPREQEEALL